MKNELNFADQKNLLLKNRATMFDEIVEHLLRPLAKADVELNESEYYITIDKKKVEAKPEYGSLWIPFTYNKIPEFELDIKYSLYITGNRVRVGFFVASDGAWILTNQKLFSSWFLTGLDQIWYNKEAGYDIRGTGEILIEWLFEMEEGFYNNYEANETFIINFRHMHLRLCEAANSYCQKRKDIIDNEEN